MTLDFDDNNLIYPPCKHCGHSHGMGIKNMITLKIEPMDICYDCLWNNANLIMLNEKQIELTDNLEKMIKFLEERLLS